MLSDFDMIVRKFDGSIKIACIADVHFGALEHMEKERSAFCNAVTADENLYLVTNGDLINNNTRSSVGSPFDDVVRPQEQKRRMVEYLEPIKDRILCGVSGNHERRSLKDVDDDPTYDIFTKLDIEDVYRPNAAFLKLQLGRHGNSSKAEVAYNIAVTHGTGGGSAGAAVLRSEKWGNTIDGVDCVIVGHTHKGTVTRPSKLVFDPRNNKITMRDYLVISCVAWQKYAEYPLQKMMLPASTGNPQILYLSDKQKRIEVRW